MSLKAKLTGLAIAAGILAGAPAAYADFPYTCDSAACFATWCAGNLRDCTDLNSPQWVYCDGDVCWADPFDAASIADALSKAIARPRFEVPAVCRRFDWAASARRHVAFYQAAIERRRRSALVTC